MTYSGNFTAKYLKFVPFGLPGVWFLRSADRTFEVL